MRFKKYIPALFIILVFAFPYKKIFSSFENTDEQKENASFYELSHFLKKALKENNTSIDNHLLVYDAQTVAHIQFYMNLLREEGINLSLTTYPAKLNAGDRIIVAQNFYHDHIKKYYQHELTDDHGVVKKYTILGRKDIDLPSVPEFTEAFQEISIYNTGR